MVTIHREKAEVEEKAGKALVEMIERYEGSSVLLLCSGGSALKLLGYVSEKLLKTLGNKITVGVLDERFTYAAEESNYVQIKESEFFARCIRAGVSVIDTTTLEGESLQESAGRYEEVLRAWFDLNSDGKVIATQGIGPDGHTSGIFPFSREEFDEHFDNDNWMVGYEFDKSVNPHTQRITATPYFIQNKIDEVLVYATGEAKCQYVAQLESGDVLPLNEFPSGIVRELGGKLFTDCL